MQQPLSTAFRGIKMGRGTDNDATYKTTEAQT